MKKLFAILMMLSLGMFALACSPPEDGGGNGEEPATNGGEVDPSTDGGDGGDPADTPEDGDGGETPEGGDTPADG